MNRSKQLRDELEQLFYELKAINVWDRAFFCSEKPGLIEFIAWKNRRRRVFQIYQALFSYLNAGCNSVCNSELQEPSDDEDSDHLMVFFKGY